MKPQTPPEKDEPQDADRRAKPTQRGDGGAARRAGGGTGPAQPEQAQRSEPPGTARNRADAADRNAQAAQEGDLQRKESLRDVEDDEPRERSGMERGAPARPGGRRRSEDPPPGQETRGAR